MAACGTAAFRKERVISPEIATDSLWSGPAEKYRRMPLHHGLHTAWSVPIVSDNGILLGTFGFHHAKAKSVGGDELQLLEKAGHIALIAIERDHVQTALTEALAEARKSEAELRTIVGIISSSTPLTTSVGCRMVRRSLAGRAPSAGRPFLQAKIPAHRRP